MRRINVTLATAVVALAIAAAPAAASYRGPSAPLVWERQAASNGNGVAVTDTAFLVTTTGTMTSCDDANGDELCSFGRPALSPNGAGVIVSRHPADAAGHAGAGTLEMLAVDGSGATVLPQMTASDTQPAFLPGGDRIVFTGRSTLRSPSQLYEVNLDGSGLTRLTVRGGSWPAPCATGAIIFQRGANLWVIPPHGRRWRRLVRNASEPDCAPDSRHVVFVDGYRDLGLIGLDGRGARVLPHGRGAQETGDRPGVLRSPAFAPGGRSIAYLRRYDVPQQDGSRDELDVADLSGRLQSRRDVADQSLGSIGSDGEQSTSDYVGW